MLLDDVDKMVIVTNFDSLQNPLSIAETSFYFIYITM